MIVNALIKTLGTIGNIVLLLVMLMYVFAIMGYYLFGQRSLMGGSDEYYWGSIGACLYPHARARARTHTRARTHAHAHTRARTLAGTASLTLFDFVTADGCSSIVDSSVRSGVDATSENATAQRTGRAGRLRSRLRAVSISIARLAGHSELRGVCYLPHVHSTRVAAASCASETFCICIGAGPLDPCGCKSPGA